MKFALILAIASIVFVGAGLSSRPNSDKRTLVPAISLQTDPVLSSLAAYRQWSRVNSSPELMQPAVAAACAAATATGSAPNPHANKYISVFVNPEGYDAMMKQRVPKFPVGSMIVKEKLSGKDNSQPELLTAMVKREPGFSAETGDWEYFVLDGAATKIVERGKLSNCNACHVQYKQQDFVTRTYLPGEVRESLR